MAGRYSAWRARCEASTQNVSHSGRSEELGSVGQVERQQSGGLDAGEERPTAIR